MLFGGNFVRKNVIQLIILASLLLSYNSTVNAAINSNTYNTCYSAGEKAFAVSDYVKAAENFSEALKYKPDDLRSHLKYAQALFSLNEYDESTKHLETVLQNSPNNIIARLYLAENYAQLGKKDSAKEQLKWILNIQPNHQKAKDLYNKLEPQNSSDSQENKETELSKNDSKTNNENTKATEIADNSNEISEPKNEISPKENIVTLVTENAKNQENNTFIEDNTIFNKQENSLSFTPYVAGETKKENTVKEIQTKNIMPAANKNITSTDMKSFFKAGEESFIVNLEKARYEIEKGDLKSAEKTVEIADKIARANNNSRNLLEAQIFKSLIYVYQCEFQKFGKHLMSLKPALSTESYQSFLDIYSKSEETVNEDEKRRLAASVAIGAGHYSIVANLLKPVFEKSPNEPIIYAMLSEAQIYTFDYKGAENTFQKFAEAHQDNAEAQFNLARFYLTADYRPDLVRKYATIAAKLNPEDARCKILIALTDYSEGKIAEGIKTINEMLPTLNDTSMKAICQRLVADGEKAKNSKSNFIKMLALPCSKYADLSTLRFAGEDELKNGSYFSALEKFAKANEGVEMGRTYLGLASALTADNEIDMASIAAGYGLKLINEDMAKGKNIARASLYKALYDCERNDKDSAIASIDLGLNCKDLDFSTYNKLISLYESLE